MRQERNGHRIAARQRQGLYWLANTPGWDRILDTLSETAELHGPGEWRVTLLEERDGRLHFASTGGDAVSDALETAAAVMSARTCHRCGRAGRTRGYGLITSWGGLSATRLETRCGTCHREEAGTEAPAEEGPSAERVLARDAQGLRWLPDYPGWEHLLEVLSESAERHAPGGWTVTHVDQKMGHLRFASADGNEVTRGLEAFAMGMSTHTCFECGAPGATRGYDPIPDPDGEGARASRFETRCDRCHERAIQR